METNVNRRSLLLGLAAASAAAAGPIAAEAAATTVENSELIRLADTLPATYDRYVEAWHADAAIRAKWLAVWPLAPDEISEVTVTSAEHPWDVPGEKEASFDGWLWRKGERWPRTITMKSHWAEAHLRFAKRQLKRKDSHAHRAEVARLKRLHKLCGEYEDECIRVKEACHDEYTAGWKAKNAASEAVCQLIGAIMAQPDETMEGLLIKADALNTFASMTERDQKAAIFEPNKWHGQIAASILRHARGGL